MLFRVYFARPVLDKLRSQFSHFSLREIIAHLQALTDLDWNTGTRRPFPYVQGTLVLSRTLETSQGTVDVFLEYEIDRLDRAVNVMDIGIVADEAGDVPF
ncbi:MAG TPA: hypothetical protein VF950_02605 [Planctomycetota bacterium]